MKDKDQLGMLRKGKQGFTLLEVVIALAVFGFLIGGLLGFLPWGVQGAGKVREQSIAYGMIDGVQVELERMGFSLVERGTVRWTNPINPQELTPWSVLLVARKEGGQVEFEMVVESNEQKMNNPDDTDEGIAQESWQSLSGGANVPFNDSGGLPVSLAGMESFSETPPYSQRWIPEGQRYFLIPLQLLRRFVRRRRSTNDVKCDGSSSGSGGVIGAGAEARAEARQARASARTLPHSSS